MKAAKLPARIRTIMDHFGLETADDLAAWLKEHGDEAPRKIRSLKRIGRGTVFQVYALVGMEAPLSFRFPNSEFYRGVRIHKLRDGGYRVLMSNKIPSLRLAREWIDCAINLGWIRES